MRVGAHVSASGGLPRAVDRAVELGCEAVQVFGSSPQSWAFRPVPPEQTAEFRRRAQEAGVMPVVLHAIYLINLGTPNPTALQRGIDSLVNYMHLASEIGALGVVFHPGSHKGVGFEGVLPQTVQAIRTVLEKSPPGPHLILENTAGMGQHIGARLAELGRIISEVASDRLGVCLDTQHLFAAGYNVADPDGLNSTMEEFEREIGLHRLLCVHANDSKHPLSSGVDRHANIGEGFIGVEGFRVIMAHPAFRDVPFLLEVPGADGKGPDRPNVERLKEIRERLGIAP